MHRLLLLGAARAEHVELVFEGLDTYAEVRLNDATILEADNMFRRWEVDVGDVLRPGDNRLDVIFHAPVASATRTNAQTPPSQISVSPTAAATAADRTRVFRSAKRRAEDGDPAAAIAALPPLRRRRRPHRSGARGGQSSAGPRQNARR